MGQSVRISRHGRLRYVRVAIVWRHGLVYGVGSGGVATQACSGFQGNRPVPYSLGRATMTPRQKRFAMIGVGVVAVALASALVLNAFRSNLVFFFTPTQIANGEVPQGRSFRIGGLVEASSLKRENDGLTVHFVVTDMSKRVPVVYKGILPDLFREGKGAVAQGQLGPDGVF